jgi:hypothetical protein
MIKRELEPTCMGETCPFWSVDKDSRVVCPLFIQTIWSVKGSNSPKVVNDCAPKRNTLLLMDYSERAIGIQQDYEGQRNKYDKVLVKVSDLFDEMQKRNSMLEEKLCLEEPEEINILKALE